MKITERAVDPLTTVVTLEGELDLYAAAEINACLLRAIEDQCLRLTVDLRDVASVDFSTIAILAQNGRLLSGRHGSLEVVCRAGEVQRLLSAAGEGGRFTVRVADD